jgi:benzoyl-CoA reductase/2-hydroxyglutaryl-CoA dehydratase subunit BcrC/BadD/HgdB
MNGEQALARLRAAYDDRLGEAARRGAAGASIVGYFLNSIPVELILAAGLDPIRLVGDPTRHAAVADRYLEEYMDGEIRSIFGSMLTGDFAFADLLILPRSSEVYLQLYYFLLEMADWEPEADIPPLYLFDLLQAPHWLSARYDLGRMHALADRLASLGRPVTDAALREAIASTNRLRSTLQRAANLWRDDKPAVHGQDSLRIIGAVSILTIDEAISTLDALLADPPVPLLSPGPRIMLKGSPQSDLHVTALIESAGAMVVAHDHVAGDPTFRVLIDTDGNPWEALASHYQRHIPGPRVHPQSDQDGFSVALAREAAVDGVIFFHDEWDDTLGWEFPDQRKLFDAAGIPSLFMKRQPYFEPPIAEQRAAVEAFLAEIKR